MNVYFKNILSHSVFELTEAFEAYAILKAFSNSKFILTYRHSIVDIIITSL